MMFEFLGQKMEQLSGQEIRAMRKKLRLTQRAFWEKVFVSQATGSRYENGEAIPPQVEVLVRLVYGCGHVNCLCMQTLQGKTRTEAGVENETTRVGCSAWSVFFSKLSC